MAADDTDLDPHEQYYDNGRGWTSRRRDKHCRAEPLRRPVVRIVDGELSRVVDEAERALIDADFGIYQRGDLIVTHARRMMPVAGGREVATSALVPMAPAALIEAFTRGARLQKRDQRTQEGWRDVDCPRQVVDAYIARPSRELPAVVALVHAPTLRADGSILQTPGYDPRSRVIYDPGETRFPEIPSAPTRDDAVAAKDLLLSAFETFAFVDEIDRAVLLSAILTALVRTSLAHAPLHGFTAPVAGSGKSKLVDCVSTIAMGGSVPVLSQGRTPEETEKRIDAALLQGHPIISLDNCSLPLGGDKLCQALTQETVSIRVLGESRAPVVPTTASFYATGNNLSVAEDMTRRTLMCRLDPRCERPELRMFPYDAVDIALERRGEIVRWALSIMRAYQVAGRPQQSVPLGSFVDWSRTVRDALIWAGAGDPVMSLEHARATDPVAAELQAVLQAWSADADLDRAVSARGLIERSGGNDDLREALVAVAGERGEINSRRLGKWLGKHRNRIMSGLRIVDAGERGGVTLWRVIEGD